MAVRSVCAIIVLLSLAACTHAPMRPEPAVALPTELEKLGLRIDVREHRLPNGLTVLMIEDRTVPLVAYQTWVRVGSVDERPGKTGLAHLFEHLMYKGTERYGAKRFFLEIEAKGGDVNAFTTRDYTVFHQIFAPHLLERVVDMEADRLTGLKLTQDVLDVERQVVFEERRMSVENDPSGKLQEAIWQLAFQRHPYRNPIIGYPQDLARIQLEDLMAFYRGYYQPSNVAVVVAGDFDSRATLELIRKHYGPIEKGQSPRRKIARESEQTSEKRLVLEDSLASERLVQAYRTTAADDDDTHALDVLSSILFDGQSSRAWRRIVEDRDIAFAVGGSNFTPTYPGLFLISATMKAGHSAAEAELELDRLIQEVQANGVTEEEIAVAIRQLTVDLVDGLRTAHGTAMYIGTVHAVFGQMRSLDQDLVKYLKVTRDDVRRVAVEYLQPNRRSVVTLMPASGKKQASDRGSR